MSELGQEKISATLKKLFTVNLGVKKNERVLVFTDRPASEESLEPVDRKRRREIQEVAAMVATDGKDYCQTIFHCYPETKRHGVEPPQPVWELAFGRPLVERLVDRGLMRKILDKRLTSDEVTMVRKIIAEHSESAVNAVVGLAWHSTSHTLFRKLLTEVCGCRYASMPEFEKPMLTGAMAVDYGDLTACSTKIADWLKTAERLRITAPNGTDLTVVRGERPVACDVGALETAGSFSNLPAGEVYFAPLEGKSEGKLVFEIAEARELDGPVAIYFQKGLVEKVSGNDPYAEYLENLFRENPACRNMAELGIGTNREAKNPLNILEAEKVWGTIHVALGDNIGFGGQTAAPFHQDYVVTSPTMTLIGSDKKEQTVLKDGIWLDL